MKRLSDLALSLLLLIALAPVFLAVAIGVWLDVGTPIIFRQRRPGFRARPFTLFKFRTMRTPDGGNLGTNSDEARLTRFGRWLRATSLDELPELWNVLRGDMSVVGPRPLLMHYVPLYSPEQMRRHEVRPGITGWAQINGRNALDWDAKFKFDVWYVDNRTIALDLRILLLTVLSVVRRRGITHDGSATMPEFTGPHALRDNAKTDGPRKQ